MDDIRQLADVKSQIITKDDIISQHSGILAMCCKVILWAVGTPPTPASPAIAYPSNRQRL